MQDYARHIHIKIGRMYTSSIQRSICIYDSSTKSNTNFVSCIIVVMSLTLGNFASKSLKFS